MTSDGVLGAMRRRLCDHVWFTSADVDGGHFPAEQPYYVAECAKCGKETEVIIE